MLPRAWRWVYAFGQRYNVIVWFDKYGKKKKENPLAMLFLLFWYHATCYAH